MELISHSLAETKQIATDLAQRVVGLTIVPGHATVVALEGELGAGKTTFVQSFVQALGLEAKVKSPTFLLIKRYDLLENAGGAGRHSLYHMDCYRINDYHELVPLDIMAILADPTNIVLIEWPERISEILPKQKITVHIDHVDDTTRKFTIN